jgi:Uma2 family endonuclease
MGANETSLLFTRHRLTVDSYYRMSEAGILPPGQRTELIDGEIIDMATIGSRHAATVARLGRLLDAVAGTRFQVRSQNPLRLGDHSEPEPDLLLVAARDDFYAAAHPVPADVKLLIEVADSTLRYDAQIKVPLYARHGVPEVWVIDLEGGVLLRHRQPRGEAYALVETISRPGVLVPDATPDLALDLSTLPLAP